MISKQAKIYKPENTHVAQTFSFLSLFLLYLCIFAAYVFASAAPAFAGSLTLQDGYYVGPGDGCSIIFHVLPNDQQATLSALNTYGGAGWRPSPLTESNIKSAGITHAPGVYTGSLKKESVAGSYLFQLGTPLQKFSHCEYVVTVKPSGLAFQQRHGFTSGCMYYHSAAWSFDAVIPHRRLILWHFKAKRALPAKLSKRLK